ncbi:MAG: hypothetical protein ACOCYU_04635, partial [Brevefilum sp.]
SPLGAYGPREAKHFTVIFIIPQINYSRCRNRNNWHQRAFAPMPVYDSGAVAPLNSTAPN